MTHSLSRHTRSISGPKAAPPVLRAKFSTLGLPVGVFLRRAEQPFEAFSRDSWQHVFRCFEFLLGLLALEVVQHQTHGGNIFDDGVPSQCHADAIA